MVTKKKKSCKKLIGKYEIKKHTRWADTIVGDVTSPKVLAELLAEAKAAKSKQSKAVK
jgi:hypothetical protein